MGGLPRLSVAVVITLAIVGAISGDAVGYAVGRRFGPGLQSSRLGQLVGDKRWRASETFLRRRGGPAVFFGRVTALLRASYQKVESYLGRGALVVTALVVLTLVVVHLVRGRRATASETSVH